MKNYVGRAFLLAMGLTLVMAGTVWADQSQVKPQGHVVCNGKYALCSFAECEIENGTAKCYCWEVEGDFILETDAIKDQAAKKKTQKKCTTSNPCGKNG